VWVELFAVTYCTVVCNAPVSVELFPQSTYTYPEEPLGFTVPPTTALLLVIFLALAVDIELPLLTIEILLEFETPPPGAGVETDTSALPAFAVSLALMIATNLLLLMNVVGRGEFCQSTEDVF